MTDNNITKITLRGHWPKHMDETEARIINRLISSILEAGYLIRVREGEEGEVLLQPSLTRTAIQRETAATGVTVYDVMGDTRFQEGMPLSLQKWERIGSIVLIHGNGEDVISDASWPARKPENEAILDRLTAPAQELSGTA